MQSLPSSQWIIIAILIVLVAGASSLFTRAISNRGTKERSIPKRSADIRSDGALPISSNSASVNRSAPMAGSSAAPAAGDYDGLKGWLLVLGILVFALPVLTGAWLWNADTSLSPSIKEQFPITVYGQRGLFLTVMALEIGTIICLARRSRRFKPFYVVTSIALMLLLPADLYWAAASIAITGGRPVSYMLPMVFTLPNIILCIIVVIPILIWLIYVLRSRRVANTFVR